MNPSNDDTQPVRAIQSGPSCLKRIVQLLVLAIGAVGIFTFGYASGSGVEILAPVNALIETAIASFPDSLQALSARSPQPTVTPQPADTVAPIITDTDTPVPTDKPSNTSVPTDTATDTPVPTNTLTDASIPTATELAPTRTPLPTDTATDTPVPTATAPPPTRTPLPTATQATAHAHDHCAVLLSPSTGMGDRRNECARHSRASMPRKSLQPSQVGERFDVLESRQGRQILLAADQ